MRTILQIKNFSSLMLRFLLTWVFAFVTRKLFIDSLGLEYLGVMGLLQNILGMLSIAELGIGSSIVFSLYEPLAKGDQQKVHVLIWLYRRWYMYIAGFIFVMGLCLYPFLLNLAPGLVHIPHYNIIFLLYLLGSVTPYFFSYNSTLYTASQKDYKIQNLNIFIQFFSSVATVLVLWLYPNFILLIFCTQLIGLAGQCYIYKKARQNWPWLKNAPTDTSIAPEDKQVITKNVRAMIFHKIGDYCIYGTDNLVISKFVSLSAVGLLANYNTVLLAFRNVVSSFFTAMIAGTGEKIVLASTAEIHTLFKEINFLAFWFFGLCSVGFYLCMDDLLTIWLGKQFLLSNWCLLFLSIDLFIAGMRIPPHIIKSGAGLFANDQYAPLIQSLINLGISIALAIHWGIAGVLLGTVISGLLVPCWYRPYVVYKDFLKVSFKSYCMAYGMYVLFLVGAAALMISLFRLYEPSSTVLALVYKIPITLIVFHLLLFLIFRKTQAACSVGHRVKNVIRLYFPNLCK